jgi:hypothetical protein
MDNQCNGRMFANSDFTFIKGKENMQEELQIGFQDTFKHGLEMYQ